MGCKTVKLRVAFMIVLLIIMTIVSASQIYFAPYAHAQGISFRTSTDSHNFRFFGESAIQVTISDQVADDDSTIESISVDIDAMPDTGGSHSASIMVPETSQSSGKFEFFMKHIASEVGPDDIDSINSRGVEGDGTCIADCAPLVTFGPDADLDMSSDLFEDVKFTITAGDEEISINYEETFATLTLDRSSYGTTSFVYISVSDQDANLNPSARDEFTVSPDSSPNDDLFELNGGEFLDDVVFEETGDNTGVFKGKYQLGSSIDANSESVVLTLHDKANYSEDLDSPENDSNNTDEVNFTVGNTNGRINAGGQIIPTWDPILDADKSSYALGESVVVSVIDKDANSNSDIIDSIELQVSESASNQITATALETDKNTGVFETSFMLVRPEDAKAAAIGAKAGDTLTIKYTDKHPADYAERIANGEMSDKDFTLKISVMDADMGSAENPATVTKPVAKDSFGHELVNVHTGQQIVLSTLISNNQDKIQPFVEIIEIRNSDQVTIFLAWQTGILNPSDQSEIGLSWTPNMPGEYIVRTFAISKFEDEVLSPVAESKITVNSS